MCCPPTTQGRLRLARAMGFADWAAFADVLDAHRRRVQTAVRPASSAPPSQVGAEADEDAEATAGPHPLAPVWVGTVLDARPGQARELILAAGRFPRARGRPRRGSTTFRDACARKGLSTRGAERLAPVDARRCSTWSPATAPDRPWSGS